MSGGEDFCRRFAVALERVKHARNRLDKLMVHVIGDSRADEPLIQLRKALNELEKVASEAA